MSHFNCTFFSNALGMYVPLVAAAPQPTPLSRQDSDGCPVLYLLHGLSDDETMWTRQTSIERYANEAGIAVIMPRADRSFYTDMLHGLPYWQFITKELPDFIDATFRFSRKPEKTFAAGNSMGGYGALKLAFNCPERFAAVGAFSPVIFPDPKPDELDRFRWERENVFGAAEASIGTNGDLRAASKKAMESGKHLPRLYTTCGTEDFLYRDNLKFQEHLNRIGWPVEFHTDPGAHTWEYWDAHLPRFLAFLELNKH